MKKRILLISQYFPPDINAASFRLNDYYEAMREVGFDVTVLTTYPQKATIEEVAASDDVHRIKLKKIEKKSFMNHLRNYFGFMFKTIFYAVFRLRRQKFDYIIVTSPPLFVALGGLVISFFKRTKLIVDIRDIWPDSAVSAGMLRKDGFLYKITKRVERMIYNRSHKVSCVSEPMKAYILGESNQKDIHVLYNGVSPVQFKQSSQHKNHPREVITIGYAGNLGIVQNMDILLEAANLLKLHYPKYRFEFMIIGEGIERQRLERIKQEQNLETVYFTGALSKEDVLERLQTADLLFLSLMDDPVFEKTIPSKVFDYLLNNKPIVTSIQGEGREILEACRCGLFFESTNPNSLVDVLLQYKQEQQSYDEAAANNRTYVEKYYNRRQIFKRFLEGL